MRDRYSDIPIFRYSENSLTQNTPRVPGAFGVGETDTKMQKTIILSLMMMAPLFAAAQQESPYRGKADGVWYHRPEGAFYQGVDADWANDPITKIIVRPWQDVTYINKSETMTTWSINNQNVDDIQDASQNAHIDVSGNLVCRYQPVPKGYYETVMPTVSTASSSYTLGQSHYNWNKYHSARPWVDGVVEMSCYDSGRVLAWLEDGTAQVNFQPLSMSAGFKYNFGSMSFFNGSTEYFVDGVRQYFERPMAPLWVKDVIIQGISYSDTYIPAGKKLTLSFYDYTYGDDGKILLRDEIYKMSCGSDDISNLGKLSTATDAPNKLTLCFRKGDNVGDLVLEDRFAIIIRGFNQEGVDIGLAGAFIDDTDIDQAHGASSLLQNKDGEDLTVSLNYTTRVPCISIRGIYDAINTDSTCLLLMAPPEGGIASPVNGDASPSQSNGSEYSTIIRTATKWDYYAKCPAYTVSGIPDWITLDVDEKERDFYGGIEADGNFSHGRVRLLFRTKALPEGVTFRKAEVFISGRGVKMNEPIVIEQGSEGKRLLGDIDANNEVNTTDVTALYNVIFGTDTSTDPAICDIDGSGGQPNTTDVTALYNIIFGTAQ